LSDKPLTIFLTVAEASGDLHAAPLIRAIRQRRPETRFVGAAGPLMAEAGCEVLADLTSQASMLTGPVGKLGYYYRMVRRLGEAIERIGPDVVVPVDSPALNWHVARAARKTGVPVFYYIAPQVWAWATWRVRKLRRLTDAVGCILPFEEEYLRARGVNAVYVGHPLADGMPPRASEPPDLTLPWYEGTWRIALLPGSRPAEIAANGPLLAAAAGELSRRWPQARFEVTARDSEAAGRLTGLSWPEATSVVVGGLHEVLERAHFAVSVSGTVTLEVAWYGVPMVVIYRTSALERALYHSLMRFVIRTKHLSLVNILAGREVVPELMPIGNRPDRVADAAAAILSDVGWLTEIRQDLLSLTSRLEPPGNQSASDNAAEAVLDLVRQT
jgi:lipid-A-disaccharide synthase